MKRMLLAILIFLFVSPAVAAPLSLVVLNADGLEVVRALGAADAVVGVSDLVSDEPEFWGPLAARPAVGRWNAPNVEAIVALKPDLVLSYRQNPGPELERQLASFGIRVLRLDFYRLSNFVDEVGALGRALGREAQAQALADWWQARLDELRTRLAQAPAPPRVLVEGFGHFRTAGRGSGIHEMVTLAGGRNLAEGIPGTYAEYTGEWAIAAQPEVILKTVCVRNSYGSADAAHLASHYAELLGRPGWQLMPAVRRRRVYLLGPDLGPGPRGIVGVIYLAHWFHPGAFDDLDPEALHADYLQRFQGLPLGGVHVYEGK